MKSTDSGCMLVSGWLPVTLRSYNGLNNIKCWNALVCRAQRAGCQFCSLDNILLYKMSYIPSLLQIIHLLIPSNTWYHRWNTQFISHIRWHTISAHLLNSYNFPHQLSTTTSLTNQLQWLLLKVWLPFVIVTVKLCVDCLRFFSYCVF